ncbi:MAG: DUF1275 domain-containing protein [Akkermansiaceae bacterium]|nr:DUF1275 domain-containing protein [Armatimonadota bacterium]
MALPVVHRPVHPALQAGPLEEDAVWPAVLLAGTAGFIDAAGYLLLAHLFTAHMSGNTVAASVSVGTGHWAAAAQRAYPLPWFIIGIVSGRLFAQSAETETVDSGSEGIRPRKYLGLPSGAAALALEAAAITGAIVVGVTNGTGDANLGWSTLFCGASLAFAMGIQNTVLRRRDRAGHATTPVRTSYISGTLTQLVEEAVDTLSSIARRRGEGEPPVPKRQMLLQGGIYAAYVTGAILSGLTTLALKTSSWWALTLPLIVLGVLIVRETKGRHTARRA